jgi:segregation and condensation protein B
MSQTPDPNTEPSRQQGVSLDELAAAFAQAMGGESVAEEPPETPLQTPPEEEEQEAAPSPETGEDDTCPIEPRSILEAMLFVGNRDNEPLTAASAAELMRGVDADEIPPLVGQLNDRYSKTGCPYRIVSDGTGYRLALTEEFHGLRNMFYGRVRQTRLSQAAIDVLAVVAYRQPLTAEQIGQMRDKPSGHVLSQLVRRGLLRIERMKTKRRTAQYYTTDRFLKLFNLESLDDFPRSEGLDQQ